LESRIAMQAATVAARRARSWLCTSTTRKCGGGCQPLLAGIDRVSTSRALVVIAAAAMSALGWETSAARTWMVIPSHAREMVASAVGMHARRQAANAANPPLWRKVAGTLLPMIPSAHSRTQLMIRKRHQLLATIVRAQSSCALMAIAAVAISV